MPINPIPFLKPILTLSSHLHLDFPKGFLPVDLPVKILKALLPSFILITCPTNLKLWKMFVKWKRVNVCKYIVKVKTY